MKRRTTRIASVVLLGLSAFAAVGIWWWLTRTPRWNVVLITLDTTRADRLGCYGHTTGLTPNLDLLAADGVLFENAYTVVPITLPAHATIHTGLLPPEHGLRINGTSRLADSTPTLSELLQRQGYRTAAFVSSLVLDARFGLARGFEKYDDRLGIGPEGPRAERSAVETVASANAWIRSLSEEPFFCWVHLFDPHKPYDDHRNEFGDRFADRPYDAEILYMDQQIGRVLDRLKELGVYDRTLIVVAGDHGEGLGDHGEETHGYLTYNSTMHVPLLVRFPESSRSGVRVSDPVSLADIFPTIISELGIEAPPGSSGRSLQPHWQSGAAEPRPCYGESEAPLMEGGWCPLRTWTTDRWKYIQSTKPELYDLLNDPGESRNLVEDQPSEAARLNQQLAEFESTLARGQNEGTVLSEQEQRALASLGYTGGHAVEQQNEHPRRDIKDTLKYAEQVHECMHMIDRHELVQAQTILEGVVAAVPDYAKAWGTLGVCNAMQGRYAVAEENYRTALKLDENQNFARIGLGRALFARDQLEGCVEQLQAAVAIEPTALDAQYYLGEACRRLERWDQSQIAFETTLAISPGFLDGEIGLANLARDRGRFDEAAGRYAGILQREPAADAAALGWARLFRKMGQPSDAVDILEVLLERSPNYVDGLLELAEIRRTAEPPTLRNFSRSIKLAERACELTNRQKVAPLRSLALAQAAGGEYEQAIETAEAALKIARESKSEAFAEELTRELDRLRTEHSLDPPEP